MCPSDLIYVITKAQTHIHTQKTFKQMDVYKHTNEKPSKTSFRKRNILLINLRCDKIHILQVSEIQSSTQFVH